MSMNYQHEMYETPSFLVLEISTPSIVSTSNPNGQGDGFIGWN